MYADTMARTSKILLTQARLLMYPFLRWPHHPSRYAPLRGVLAVLEQLVSQFVDYLLRFAEGEGVRVVLGAVDVRADERVLFHPICELFLYHTGREPLRALLARQGADRIPLVLDRRLILRSGRLLAFRRLMMAQKVTESKSHLAVLAEVENDGQVQCTRLPLSRLENGRKEPSAYRTAPCPSRQAPRTPSPGRVFGSSLTAASIRSHTR